MKWLEKKDGPAGNRVVLASLQCKIEASSGRIILLVVPLAWDINGHHRLRQHKVFYFLCTIKE